MRQHRQGRAASVMFRTHSIPSNAIDRSIIGSLSLAKRETKLAKTEKKKSQNVRPEKQMLKRRRRSGEYDGAMPSTAIHTGKQIKHDK